MKHLIHLLSFLLADALRWLATHAAVGTLVSCTDVLTVAPADLLVLMFYDIVQVRYCFEAVPWSAVGCWVHTPSGG